MATDLETGPQVFKIKDEMNEESASSSSSSTVAAAKKKNRKKKKKHPPMPNPLKSELLHRVCRACFDVVCI